MSRIDILTSCTKDATEKPTVHLLPCKIEHNGEAEVDEYFQSCIKDDGKGMKKVSFRGRMLMGEKVAIPDGYSGYLLRENRKPVTDDQDRSFRAIKRFSEFTHWNLEDRPCLNDKIRKAMQWIYISSAIHQPVKTDTVMAKIT
ncbi:ribonuclease H2 subunit C-like [Xenia sp. Carnegie-2017]|uniref:ribonuclease H2 subunit C-like n=1 Tax=Xenia sp. Carnegie-2017 TaxID=2897299 RepID=UPI001F037862|nr:ribonuclease H2 subunit C-like [Xenia sp. Carnegie-2017]